MLCCHHSVLVVFGNDLRLKPYCANLVCLFISLYVKEAQQCTEPYALVHRSYNFILQSSVVVTLSGKYMDRFRIKPHRGTGGVHGNVSASYEHNLLPCKIPCPSMSHLLQEICRRHHIFRIGILHGHTVSKLRPYAEVDRIVLILKLFKGYILSDLGP